MATLMVTPFTPSGETGRSLRTVGVARALARTDDVEVAYVEFDGGVPSPALVSERRVSLRKLRPSRGLGRALAYLRSRFRGTPAGFARGVSAELIREGQRSAEFARVVADGPIAAAALLLVAGARPVVYCAHNIESGRMSLAGAHRDSGSPSAVRAFERSLLTEAEETWVPTALDAEEARSIAQGARLRRVPNVVDVASITPVVRGGSRRVLFVGDFSYEPNRRAARFLVHEVMPRLWRTTPSARLALVGRSLELPVRVDHRIEALGYVADLPPVYASADCAVVPVTEGGGSQLKFIEALAFGLPVVATPFAGSRLEGATAGVQYVEADGADEMAEALAVVLSSSDDELGRKGRQLAEAEYSIEALASRLAERGEGVAA
jgi:glycosyltransferase involved in cell wall biosynthesis